MVKRSHRIDGECFYSRQVFQSTENLIKKHRRYANCYNIAKQKYDFKSPNQVVVSYFKQLAENAVEYIALAVIEI